MGNAPSYRRIMSGHTGTWAAPLRAGLWAVSRLYAAAVAVRNRRFDSDPTRTTNLPVPVISVGNITAGGTGKTPLVIELVRRLQEQGRRPAVVSRGYKASANQTADELLLVARRLGDVITVASPDRVAGGHRAIQQGADIIVLDDAFQHRRIGRDLNIVVIDATCPFGYGHLLPRGLLREPLGELARADLIAISRSDAVSAPRLEAIGERIREYNPTVPMMNARHHPTHLAVIDGSRAELDTLRGRQVICVAGIGNPDAFFTMIERLGATTLRSTPLPDHTQYDAATFQSLSDAVREFPRAECLLTTEKDLVKMAPSQWEKFPLPIMAPVIDFVAEDDRMLVAALDGLPAPPTGKDPDAHPTLPTS